jgi:hypothetical protein
MCIRDRNRAYLAELMPLLVAADSVEVNAIDLRARGMVRISFNNRSLVTVNKPFVVILYEDINGDYQYTRYIDKRLGSISVNGIEANEIKVYQIDLDNALSFPNRALYSFIDATDQIQEHNERNNVKSSGTTCEGYSIPEYVQQIDSSRTAGMWGNADSLLAGLTAIRDTTIFCYLKDFNGDTHIDEEDTLCIVYTHNYRLYAVNAITHDSLFTSIFVGPAAVTAVRIDDFTNDGIPEIIAGTALYSNEGTLIQDFTAFFTSVPVTLSSFDINKDGEGDLIGHDIVDSCVTIRSGRDSSLLFVSPISRWTGAVVPVTVPVLADAYKGDYHCFDVNVSFPRYSVTSSDTVDLTIRVANAGAYLVNNTKLEFYADTVTRDSSLVDGFADLPADVIKIGEKTTGIMTVSYTHLTLPTNREV